MTPAGSMQWERVVRPCEAASDSNWALSVGVTVANLVGFGYCLTLLSGGEGECFNTWHMDRTPCSQCTDLNTTAWEAEHGFEPFGSCRAAFVGRATWNGTDVSVPSECYQMPPLFAKRNSIAGAFSSVEPLLLLCVSHWLGACFAAFHAATALLAEPRILHWAVGSLALAPLIVFPLALPGDAICAPSLVVSISLCVASTVIIFLATSDHGNMHPERTLLILRVLDSGLAISLCSTSLLALSGVQLELVYNLVFVCAMASQFVIAAAIAYPEITCEGGDAETDKKPFLSLSADEVHLSVVQRRISRARTVQCVSGWVFHVFYGFSFYFGCGKMIWRAFYDQLPPVTVGVAALLCPVAAGQIVFLLAMTGLRVERFRGNWALDSAQLICLFLRCVITATAVLNPH